MTAATLFPACVLPGCSTPVADPTQVCDGCLAAFGDMLQTTDRPLTAEQIAERDEQVQDAYRLQAQTAANHHRAIEAGETKKPNQLCWVCEERRSCKKTRQGWECDDCGEIR